MGCQAYRRETLETGFELSTRITPRHAHAHITKLLSDTGGKEKYIFIGPESDHCKPLSITHSLTNYSQSRLVDLIDVTLTCEDANSKLVEVVTIADVDADDLDLKLMLGRDSEDEI